MNEGIDMKGYKFVSPQKNKVIYIIINLLIVITTLALLFIYSNKTIVTGLCFSVLLLFNGIWGFNKKNYSFIHRDDKGYSTQYAWIIFLILGFLLLILCIVYFIVYIY